MTWTVESSASSASSGNTLEGRDGIQRDLDRLERWGCANLMKFSKTKCKDLHLGQDNTKHKHRLNGEWNENSPEGSVKRDPLGWTEEPKTGEGVGDEEWFSELVCEFCQQWELKWALDVLDTQLRRFGIIKPIINMDFDGQV
ncbi:hypothetical protein WISP_34398 [Willisornis vidua]|uniref:Rna-directed dna polymerase from mobile element jockey-like n=1 Tax=Willisornis vidua TaxID=1566151 RepID=A0ABQ9DJS3_9PASS|nr:hypothetical protein WISP_34398 [Willisornis vidua]